MFPKIHGLSEMGLTMYPKIHCPMQLGFTMFPKIHGQNKEGVRKGSLFSLPKGATYGNC